MLKDTKINCPQCNSSIKLDEVLQGQFDEELNQQRAAIEANALVKAKRMAAGELEKKEQERREIVARMQEQERKLAEAQKAQADALRKQRELDDFRREAEVLLQKRVQESLATERDKARRELEEQHRLKDVEKELQLSALTKQIDELKRRVEQGSQQLQGEALEMELEALLRARFTTDIIEAVPKGEHGGDMLHRVCNGTNKICGTILWETKRTKNWSDGWLSKLRDDQRTAKAEIAIIVSQALPKDSHLMDWVDGIWVIHPSVTIPAATLVRQALVEVSHARTAGEGQQGKMELVYQYLTGSPFRQRVQAIIEAFSSMSEDLDRERKVFTKNWAKREAELERVMTATLGMYGDLQGIAGKSLQEIEGIEWPALAEPVQVKIKVD